MLGLHEHILLFRIQKLRDQRAFDVLYGAYAQRIMRFLTMKIGDPDVVDDLAQEIFLKAWKYLVTDEPVEYPQALFFRIARNTVADHYRRADPLAISLDDEDLPEISVQSKVIDEIDTRSDIAIVSQLLPRLRDSYRAAIELRFLQELSIDEIAQVLNKTPGTVRVLIHRAITALEALKNEHETIHRTHPSEHEPLTEPRTDRSEKG